MKIAICLAHNYNSFSSEFVFSLMRMTDFFHKNADKKYELFTIKRGGYQLDEMRNGVVEDALKFDADYLLFLDTDIVLPEFTITRMLEVFEANKTCEAVTGVYTWKKPPYMPQIFGDFNKKTRKFHIIAAPLLDQPFWVGGCGAGIMMVKSEVFKRTKRPWFKFIQKGEDKYLKEGMGEDLYFAWKCKPKMLCDPHILGGHMDTRPVTLENFIKHNHLKIDKKRVYVTKEQEKKIDKEHQESINKRKIR